MIFVKILFISRTIDVFDIKPGDVILKENDSSTYAYVIIETDAANGKFKAISAADPNGPEEEVILRFRDDCRRFDIREKAAHWEEDPLHPETTVGIRMVMKGCKILQYDNSLRTNNLLVVL